MLYPHHIHATPSSINDVQKERELIKGKLSKKEQEIVSVLNEIEKLQAEIAKTEAELAKNEAKITETEAKIMEYEEEFYRLLDEIKALTETISEREKMLANRMAAYQAIGGDVTYLEVIFSARSFSQFISRVNSVTTITNADKELIEQQMNDREKVEQYQEEIVHKLTEQEKLMEELEKIKASISLQQDTLASSKKSLEEKQATLSKEVAALKSEDNELKNLEETYRKRIEEAARQQREREAQRKENSAGTQTSTTTAKQEGHDNKQVKEQKNTKSDSKSPMKIGKTMRMEATAYGADCKGCSGYTATGMWVGGNSPPKVIAVDPSVIPLGTRVWVEGYGEAIAADTGGAIKGNRIDVLVKSEAYAAKYWGRRTVTVKILD